jgi:hypothetical protein
MTYSDRVIQYVRESYLEPASKSGSKVVRVRAGDVHKALQWNNRVPSVCQTLASRRFLEENHLELVEKHGPPSGLSTTTVYTYRMNPTGSPREKKSSPLLSLRGAGKKAFSMLGGGEKFLKEERERWNETTSGLPRRKK